MEKEISLFEIYDGSGNKPVSIKMGDFSADCVSVRNDTMT